MNGFVCCTLHELARST